MDAASAAGVAHVLGGAGDTASGGDRVPPGSRPGVSRGARRHRASATAVAGSCGAADAADRRPAASTATGVSGGVVRPGGGGGGGSGDGGGLVGGAEVLRAGLSGWCGVVGNGRRPGMVDHGRVGAAGRVVVGRGGAAGSGLVGGGVGVMWWFARDIAVFFIFFIFLCGCDWS